MGTATFYHLLVNTLVVSIMNFTVWFAITFYVYLQTRSVFATGMVAGIFLVATALTGIWFGSVVDHHRKKSVMQLSALISLTVYAGCFLLYQLTPHAAFTDPGNPLLWVFIVALMLGVIAGNLRSIAMPTLVTALIAADRRDRANGLVGTASGVSFLVTSVISGLLVGAGGMFYVLILAMAVLALAMIHLDAYGLSLMSVQAWGLGGAEHRLHRRGLVIAKTGLSSNPARLLFGVNLVLQKVVPYERQGRSSGSLLVSSRRPRR